MIQLKNVSKYYYSKGMIASGFTKVNLELDVGEFVVITGESGSGKTTLLNVISGLDSYEEGEMYIDGQETSHYSAADFEEYRKKYIGNIFQHYDLINSYTVRQNIELILLINGYPEEEIREKVPAIIEKVGLTDHADTKVSKLSGGQKQRVSIARALAKDTSVLVADEPTGNLDSRSAGEIVRLLSEIAEDKLVVVVTHNYEQFAEYATRIIKMNDGRIVEDKEVREIVREAGMAESFSDDMTLRSKIRLGIRNAFNIIPKFILLLIVFLFIVFATTGIYTGFKESGEQTSIIGSNQYFQNYSPERIVVKKSDKSQMREADFRTIEKIKGVKNIEKDDVLLDSSAAIEKGELSYFGYLHSIDSFRGRPDVGSRPDGNGEAILCASKSDSYLSGNADKVIGHTYTLSLDSGDSAKVRITGIEHVSEETGSGEGQIYLSNDVLNKFRDTAYLSVNDVKTTAGGRVCRYSEDEGTYKVVASSRVEKGKAVVSEEMAGYYSGGNAVGKSLKISASNMYYSSTASLKIANVYKKSNFKELTGLSSFDSHEGEIYISKADYKALFYKGIYQSSVFADDSHSVDDIVAQLKKDGFRPLALKDSLQSFGGTEILDIIQVPFYVLMVLAIFFISYFVIKLILKSRNSYFAILRILGLPRKSSKRILDIELFAVINIAFLIFVAAAVLVSAGVIDIQYVQNLVSYMQIHDYVIIYVVLVLMAYLISSKFARSIFKKSAMDAYRGEA